MKLKERISSEINVMSIDELLVVYQHIALLKKQKRQVQKPLKRKTSIEEILEMSSSSTSCWTDTIIKERADRICS